jgi:hypothetical protein
LAEATERVVLEGKTQEPAIGLVPDSVQGISVEVIALAVGQVAALPRCRRTAALAQTASVIGLSHRDPGSVPITTLLAEADLMGAPLAQQVTAEGPAWEALDSAVVVAEEGAHVLEEARVEAVGGVEGRQAIDW